MNSDLYTCIVSQLSSHTIFHKPFIQNGCYPLLLKSEKNMIQTIYLMNYRIDLAKICFKLILLLSFKCEGTKQVQCSVLRNSSPGKQTGSHECCVRLKLWCQKKKGKNTQDLVNLSTLTLKAPSKIAADDTFILQCNLPTTATHGTAKKWLLQGGERYGEVKYRVKLHFGDILTLAAIGRWLLLRGDRSWRFHCIYFYLSKKIRHDVSCQSSAKQRIHMKYQVLFHQKKTMKTYSRLSSAAEVIGVLRVK